MDSPPRHPSPPRESSSMSLEAVASRVWPSPATPSPPVCIFVHLFQTRHLPHPRVRASESPSRMRCAPPAFRPVPPLHPNYRPQPTFLTCPPLHDTISAA